MAAVETTVASRTIFQAATAALSEFEFAVPSVVYVTFNVSPKFPLIVPVVSSDEPLAFPPGFVTTAA